MYLETVKKYESERPYGNIELPADEQKIYPWEHETQESTPVAASLLEFIEQYYEGKKK